MNDDKSESKDAKSRRSPLSGWTVGGAKGTAGVGAALGLPVRTAAHEEECAAAFWFTPATVGLIGLCAAASLTLIDLAVGKSLGHDTVTRVVLAAAAAPTLFLGVVTSVLLAIGTALLARRGRPHDGVFARIGTGLLAAAALAAFAHFNRDLFDGPGIRSWKHVRIAAAAFWIVGPLIAVLAAVGVRRHFLKPRRERSPAAWTLGAMIALAFAAALQVVDALVYPKGYPALHLQCAALAAILHFIAWANVFAAIEDRARIDFAVYCASAVIAGSLAIGMGAWARTAKEGMIARETARDTIFPLAAKTSGVFERLILDRVKPLPKVRTEDVSSDIARIFDGREMKDDLDRVLGPERKHWNLLMISVDTLRHDAAGFTEVKASEHRRRTPNLNRLARESIAIDRAYTPYPTSNYAYSSIFSGFYPHQTPVREKTTGRELNIPQKPHLAEILRDKGFTTAAFTGFNAAGLADAMYFETLKSGFDVFNPDQSERGYSAKETVAHAVDFLAKRDPEKRFFLWLHFMEPHQPYEPSAKFDFGATARGLYDSEIAGMDLDLAPIVNQVLRPPLRDDTIIVFFSDHGESFGEHNTRTHNNNLFDVETRVPFFIRLPNTPPKKLEKTIGLVDLFPTLTKLLAVDAPARAGRDFSRILVNTGKEEAWSDFAFSEIYPREDPSGRRRDRAVVFGKNKIIRRAGDPAFAIYDLAADPDELKNIADVRNPLHRRLASLLEEVDARADALLGGGESAVPSERKSVEDIILLLTNADPLDDWEAMVRLGMLIIDRGGNLYDEVVDAVGADTMTKLRETLVATFDQRTDNIDLRHSILYVLIAMDDATLEPFMRKLTASSDVHEKVAGSLWLVRHGDDAEAPTIRETMAEVPGAPNNFEWRLVAATAMSQIGDPAAAPILHTALAYERPTYLRRTLAGLIKVGYPDILSEVRERLELGYGTWQLPLIEGVIVDLAEKRTGDDAKHMLARLAFSRSAEIQARARAALAQRIPASRMNAVFGSLEQEMLGDDSVRDERFDSAAGHYESAMKLLDGAYRDDFLVVKYARSICHLDRSADVRPILETMVADPDTQGFARAHARTLLAMINEKAPAAVAPASAPVGAEVAPLIIPKMTLQLFDAEVTLKNDGDFTIAGGFWSTSVRLKWLFKEQATGQSFYDIAVFLPSSGLPPRGSLKLTVLGRTPGRPGTWTPQLVLGSKPWNEQPPRVLAELPAFTIEAAK